MSWLFGIKNPQMPPPPPTGSSSGAPGAPSGGGGGDSNRNEPPRNTESQYRFDSAALERAAKAAKDLEKSPHARDLLELSRSQEKTKQMEYEKQIKEMETYQIELQANAAQKVAEEKRKLLDEETRHNQEVNLDF